MGTRTGPRKTGPFFCPPQPSCGGPSRGLSRCHRLRARPTGSRLRACALGQGSLMALPSAPAQLSPPASALPLLQWVRAWSMEPLHCCHPYLCCHALMVADAPCGWWNLSPNPCNCPCRPLIRARSALLWSTALSDNLVEPSAAPWLEFPVLSGRLLAPTRFSYGHSNVRMCMGRVEPAREDPTAAFFNSALLIRTRYSAGAIEALLARTALAGAFPHAPHMPSWRAVAALRAQHSRRAR